MSARGTGIEVEISARGTGTSARGETVEGMSEVTRNL